MTSYQYRKYHYGDKTILLPSWSRQWDFLIRTLFLSLCNLTGTSAAVLPMCLSNCKAIRWFKQPISQLRDLTISHLIGYWNRALVSVVHKCHLHDRHGHPQRRGHPCRHVHPAGGGCSQTSRTSSCKPRSSILALCAPKEGHWAARSYGLQRKKLKYNFNIWGAFNYKTLTTYIISLTEMSLDAELNVTPCCVKERDKHLFRAKSLSNNADLL